jgi:hypothetical protein
MELLIKFTLGMVGAFNFVMNISKLFRFGRDLRQRKTAKRQAAGTNNIVGKTRNSNAALHSFNFYTNYNDLLVSSTKGI